MPVARPAAAQISAIFFLRIRGPLPLPLHSLDGAHGEPGSGFGFYANPPLNVQMSKIRVLKKSP